MHFFDAHCDILSAIYNPRELLSNKRHWDVERALSNGPFFQVFSLFAEDGSPGTRKKRMEDQLEMVHEAERLYPEKLKMVRSIGDLDEWLNKKDVNQVRYMIEAEGAEILGESLEELDRLYDRGLRILTLSWNYDNAVCDSVAGQNTHNGLSEFGRQVVERAESLGIIIDLSHCSDKTFSDVEEIAAKPFIASHSNSRTLCKHRRNLTDSQIISIAKRGGIIGINLFPPFLTDSGNALILDIIRHIEYISALVGISYVGFGFDFDGIGYAPEAIRGVEDTIKVAEALLRLNYSEESVKGITGLNFAGLMRRILSGCDN
ncbi:MAG TPA: M19 family membrane dipeptidase [Clostridiaceae bacterium]|nr:M19 family membrane dipeptidase [Clostridiaceae bacterium]